MPNFNQSDQLCYVMSKLFDIPDLLNNQTFKEAVEGIFETDQPADVLIDHLFSPSERANYSSPKPWTFGKVFLEACDNDLKVAQNIISGISRWLAYVKATDTYEWRNCTSDVNPRGKRIPMRDYFPILN